MARAHFGARGSVKIPSPVKAQIENLIAEHVRLTVDMIYRGEMGIWLKTQNAIAEDLYRRSLRALRDYIYREQARNFEYQKVAALERSQKSQKRFIESTLGDISGGKPPSTGPYNLNRLKGTPERIGFRIMIEDDTLLRRILFRASNEMRLNLIQFSRSRFERVLPTLLIAAFNEVAAGLPDQAFPKEYLVDIIAIIQSKGRFGSSGGSPSEYWVEIHNVFEALGNSKDLYEGYHYGAVKNMGESEFDTRAQRYRDARGRFLKFSSFNYSDSNRINLPYTGQTLRSTELNRYKYWSAMSSGRKSITYMNITYKKFAGPTKSGKAGYMQQTKATKEITVPIAPDAWEKTKQARLNFWRSIGRAPQWLLLEYGQMKWAPGIPTPVAQVPTGVAGGVDFRPGNVTGIFMEHASYAWTKLVQEAWTTAWKDAQEKERAKPLGNQILGNRQRLVVPPFEEKAYTEWWSGALRQKQYEAEEKVLGKFNYWESFVR